MARKRDKGTAAPHGTTDRRGLSRFGVESAAGGIIYTSSSVIRSGGTLALLILLARLLGPYEFGLYSIVFAIASFLGLNSDYGLGFSLKKKLPEADGKARINSLISSSMLITLVIGIVLAAGSVLLGRYVAVGLYSNPQLTSPIIVSVCSLVFSALFILTTSALLGLRKNAHAGISYIIHAILQFIFSAALVLLGYGVYGALLGMLLSYLAAFAVALALLFIDGYRPAAPQKAVIREITTFSAPILVSNITVNGTRNLGIVLLGIVVAASVVGNYGAGYRLATFGDVIIASCIAVLLPMFSHALTTKKLSGSLGEMFNRSLYYTLLFLLPILAYLISVSKPLFNILFSSSYAMAASYFPIMVVGISATILFKYAGTLLLGYGKVRSYTKYQLIGALAITILLALLTPTLKLYGVMFVLFVASPILLGIIFTRALAKELRIRVDFGRPIRLTAASLLLLVVLECLPLVINAGSYALLLNAALTVLLYPPFLALLGAVRGSDTGFVEEVGRRLRISIFTAPLMAYTNLFAAK
jgi:stage V sporulation protein B